MEVSSERWCRYISPDLFTSKVSRNSLVPMLMDNVSFRMSQMCVLTSLMHKYMSRGCLIKSTGYAFSSGSTLSKFCCRLCGNSMVRFTRTCNLTSWNMDWKFNDGLILEEEERLPLVVLHDDMNGLVYQKLCWSQNERVLGLSLCHT